MGTLCVLLGKLWSLQTRLGVAVGRGSPWPRAIEAAPRTGGHPAAQCRVPSQDQPWSEDVGPGMIQLPQERQ